MKKNDHELLLNRIRSGAPVYLLNDYEEAVCRLVPDKGPDEKWFIKFKGEEEREALHSHRIVKEAISEAVTITEAEYNAY